VADARTSLGGRFGAALSALRGKSASVTKVEPQVSAKLAAVGRVASGQSVTPDSAMQLAAVWACVRLISETVATMPLILYQTAANGARTVAENDPLYSLLHQAPNADNTAVEFWEGVTLALCLWGNAFAKKEMSGGRLVALTPLAADRMVVARTPSGALEYRYTDRKGRAVYREDQVFHVRGFGGSADVGLSPISFARQSLGTAMATDQMAGALFANGARPSGILTVEQILTAEQRQQLRENIVAPFVGAENAGGLMVLEAGLQFQQVTMTPEDSQFLETRAFQVEEICRWFRVPPFMVGHTEKTSSWGTGLEQQLIAFLTFALKPYLVRIEQAVSRSLLRPEQRQTLKPEFKVEGLLRTDSAARSAFYAIMVQNGIMTRNEVRRLENLPPITGGDDLTVQSQNVPLGQTGETSK
jgi:HK97 family phage portal protein